MSADLFIGCKLFTHYDANVCLAKALNQRAFSCKSTEIGGCNNNKNCCSDSHKYRFFFYKNSSCMNIDSFSYKNRPCVNIDSIYYKNWPRVNIDSFISIHYNKMIRPVNCSFVKMRYYVNYFIPRHQNKKLWRSYVYIYRFFFTKPRIKSICTLYFKNTSPQ